MRVLSCATVATAIVLAGLSIATWTKDASAETRLLRYGEFGPNRGTRAAAMKWLDQELRKRTNDELGIDFIWGGALLGAKTAVDGVADGVADMGSIVPVYSPGKLVTYEVADVIQFGDEWVGMNAVHDLMTQNPIVLKEWNDANLVYFANFTTGPTQLLSKQPVTSAEDVKGMTIRATGAFVPAFKSSGANTVSVGQPKVYEALSNGTVDGSTTYYYVVKAYKHYELINHVTELNMGQVLAFGIAMNKDSWNSLSPAHQEVVAQLGRDFTNYMAERMWESRRDVKAELQEGIEGHKITVHAPDPKWRDALVAVADKDADKWLKKAGKKNLDGAALLQSYRDLIAKYSAERDAKGYPWAR
jgi:TRAP-type C4-dicarboxylate transport system substrate-binding protein